ncbi:hypothetical protein Sdagh_31860 [Streptomyces daghestanicus]|uniref:Uncharacterized protein n=1 Tax=Streptomyces daghestanicus TaxID=66885 RepID=A0ABQ3Q2G5_9ACTN|nr:hypothetical protein GCM10010240_28950 [Streptomyces griseoviridis]GHI31456.1 hypothetical protein Sdagh_31860 [Streptomyces daghestanicus]
MAHSTIMETQSRRTFIRKPRASSAEAAGHAPDGPPPWRRRPGRALRLLLRQGPQPAQGAVLGDADRTG